MSEPIREARLRPEFAEHYPGLEAGIWYTAATLAEHLLGRFIRGDAADRPQAQRILGDRHFEFRGPGGIRGGRIILGR